ncbi:uncharacterized protein At4g06598 isoform X1 [Amborella trichopoda]|uniref:uncharacterized protein At4g06598 isoform X1 n=1 Tax=Amborella trichopoda TaxID=13333 RepID=UPI0005D36519|nr:uncharacterized protein At4g06598 isoform X1 [Amborella trichopoda]XP_020532210.1 uncharacterized protein At4g06598 isoform X1 [Amborella trichopoda]|eukprot:XP_020532209.1 uncharacterized protein At4g06598 isoform X1 [Amborella trichopoda]
MSNDSGVAQMGNWSHSGKQLNLPPRIPFPSMAPAYSNCGSSPLTGKPCVPISRKECRQHQRTSSESFLIEEQPSWLDDLLNEPETPIGKGAHRRSSSDSIAYMDYPGTFSKGVTASQEDLNSSNIQSFPFQGFLDYDNFKDETLSSFCSERNSLKAPYLRGWEPLMNSCRMSSCRDNKKLESLGKPFESARVTMAETQGERESGECDSRFTESKESSYVNSVASEKTQNESFERRADSHLRPASEADPKRAKQHFAQRSRVRKLQYIAELERNVSTLQAEESEMSAEISFLNQQLIILSLENKALKQRLNSVAHEKRLKDAQYELLTKEVERLRGMYRKQQQMKSQHQCGRPGTYLEVQLSNLSLNSLLTHSEKCPEKEPNGATTSNTRSSYSCMMLQNS